MTLAAETLSNLIVGAFTIWALGFVFYRIGKGVARSYNEPNPRAAEAIVVGLATVIITVACIGVVYAVGYGVLEIVRAIYV